MLVLLGAMHLCCVWHHCFKMPALQLGSHVVLQFCSLHWSSFLHSKEHIKVHQPFYLSGREGCYNRLVTGNQLREGSAGPFHEEAFQLWQAQTVLSSAISLSVCDGWVFISYKYRHKGECFLFSSHKLSYVVSVVCILVGQNRKDDVCWKPPDQ